MDEPWKQYALRERKQSQKISYCMKSSFIWSVHNGQIHRERLVFARGWGLGKKKKMSADKHDISFLGEENQF